MEEDLINLNEEEIAPKILYQNYIDDINNCKISVSDIDGGQVEHMALKLVGRNYLKKEGYSKVKFEEEFEGLRPDIITLDKKIIIE